MDTVVALLRAVAHAGRGLFDMVSMAVGVPPSKVPLADAAVLPVDGARKSETNSRRYGSEPQDAPRGSTFNEWCYRKHRE